MATPAPTQSSSTTPQKLPFPQAPRMACTHLTMQRFYGDLQCPICRRDPDLGYTYLCSQDEMDGLSGDAMEVSMELLENVGLQSGAEEESGLDQVGQGVSASHTKLSPWIEEAIAKGEYTPEQVTILRAQKQKVNDTIATTLENFKIGQISASDKQSTVAPATEDTSSLPFPVITGANDRIGSTETKRPEARLFPYCVVRACQTCRPTFRDRAWQKLEEIFTVEAPTIDFENDNRRLSNASVVAKLGLQKSAQNLARPHLQTFGSFSFYQNPRRAKRALSATTVRQRPSTTGSKDIADQRVEGENVGFRDSVKRALRGMLFNRRDSTSSRQSSRSSRLISRKMRVREEDSTDFDTGLWRRFNDELLREASITKLPGHDGMDGLETQNQEVEVEDGVAVTEEAVDTGTPDVIMSV